MTTIKSTFYSALGAAVGGVLATAAISFAVAVSEDYIQICFGPNDTRCLVYASQQALDKKNAQKPTESSTR